MPGRPPLPPNRRRPKLARTVSEPNFGRSSPLQCEWQPLRSMSASSLLVWSPSSPIDGASMAEFFPHSPRRRRVTFASDVCFLRGEVLKEKTRHPKLNLMMIEEIDLGTPMLVPTTPFRAKSSAHRPTDDASINSSASGKKLKAKRRPGSDPSSYSLTKLQLKVIKLRRKICDAHHKVWVANSVEEELRKQNSRVRQQLLRSANETSTMGQLVKEVSHVMEYLAMEEEPPYFRSHDAIGEMKSLLEIEQALTACLV